MPHIFGMDNALMDIILQVSDEKLKDLHLEKGVDNFFTEEQLKSFEQYAKDAKLEPGGCGANTLSTMAQLGAETIFCGKVGKDEYGKIYEDTLVEQGVTSKIIKAEGHTGRAITFVTPDAQRTFALTLGVANTLKPEELDEESIRESGILYLTTYLLGDPEMKPTALKAIDLARAAGKKVALDLSDPNVVRENIEELRTIVKEKVDILFANETEAEEFTGKQLEQAAMALGSLCEIAIVKIGEYGSLINVGGSMTRVKAHKVRAVDTTGAGDAYAAGFLYGFIKGYPVEVAGDLGSLLASKVICQLGARLKDMPTEEIKNILT